MPRLALRHPRLRLRPALGVAALLLAFVLLATGCATGCGSGDYRARAVGPNGEVTIVMDTTRWNGPLGEAARRAVAPSLRTLPQPQPLFDVRRRDMRSALAFNQIKERKHVVFVAPLGDSTREARFLRQRFSDEARAAIEGGQPAVIKRGDLWRRGQIVYYVTAATPEGVMQALEASGPAIRDTLLAATLDRMEGDMFEKGRQVEVERALMQRHGFAVKVQHDYQVAVDTTTDSTGVVWMRRFAGGSKGPSRRSLLAYYEEDADPARLTPERIYALRDSLTRQYMRGNVGGYVQIDHRRALQTEQIDFLGRYGFETRGLWYMVGPGETEGELLQYGGGGPFVTYSFYDQPSGRLYLLDGQVFAPGYNTKRQFLRQLDVIARTFRTRAEAPPDDAALAER